jgi:hypothetical protein
MLQDRRQLLERGRHLRLASFHLLFSDSLSFSLFFTFYFLFLYIYGFTTKAANVSRR